jgi:tRNA(Ile)-lysidine synthase
MPRQPDLYSQWSGEMRRSGLFRPGERVGVAVSGGPDSVLLLDFMPELARRIGLSLAVVHFNHHLRGTESDRDEAFVRDLAQAHGLEFLHGEADVGRVARQRRRNLEAIARELRYGFFLRLIRQGALDKVATAHTANDQAETVLLHLLRGAGTRGLGGIYPVVEGKVVRPFLDLTRAEIELELERRKLVFQIDSTNLNPTFRRNKVRLELLPLLQKEYNPELIRLLKELADRARDDEAYLEQQVRERAQAWRTREGKEEKIPLSALLGFPPAVERRVLRQMIQGAGGHLRGVTHRHIEALRRFVRHCQSGHQLVLPGQLVARREFDWLIMGSAPPGGRGADYSYQVEAPGEVTVGELGLTFRLKIVGSSGPAAGYNKIGVVGLNPLKLSGRLALRNWRSGDRFWPVGSRKPRKLKDLFCQRKIPLGLRKLWPLLTSEEEIVWVRGFAPAVPVAAEPGTRCLTVTVEESHQTD